MSTRSKPAPAGGKASPSPDPTPLPGAGLGEVAYRAYSDAVDGKSIGGANLPTWDDQVKKHPDIAAAWCAAAQAVIAATFDKE